MNFLTAKQQIPQQQQAAMSMKMINPTKPIPSQPPTLPHLTSHCKSSSSHSKPSSQPHSPTGFSPLNHPGCKRRIIEVNARTYPTHTTMC